MAISASAESYPSAYTTVRQSGTDSNSITFVDPPRSACKDFHSVLRSGSDQ
jgi:hypothetical protein